MSQYKNEENEHYLIRQLEEAWKKTKPFAGLTILVNAHITSITCELVDILKNAGATVDTTSSLELFVQKDKVQRLMAANVNYYPDGIIPSEKCDRYYDIVYDCSAGMLNVVTPKKGMVELTHTDLELYKNISFPVITIDHSRTKYLETSFGTGDSVTRVITQLAKDAIRMAMNLTLDTQTSSFSEHQLAVGLLGLMDINNLFNTKKYMIFGYGKVGKGIASALKNAGVPAGHIYVIDILPEAYIQIKEDGFQAFYLNYQNKPAFDKMKTEIRRQLQDIFAVITATGIKNAISDVFDADDFKSVSILINMGTLDEFGDKFTEDSVLNNKKPANFLLPYPTQLKFLDAIFSIYAMAGVELYTRKLGNGYHHISYETDQTVLNNWVQHYSENIWEYGAEKGSVNKMIDSFVTESNHKRQISQAQRTEHTQ